MQLLVSILIPCYNAAPWLAETLDCVLSQTWENKEIILVDDGSNDDSVDIAHAYEHRGVTVITQANKGASAARNAAFSASQGQWIQYLDADDLLAPDKIERQMSMAAREGPERIICARWARFYNSLADAFFAEQPLCADANPVDWVVRKASSQVSLMMHPAAWLASRELIERAGPWDERLSLDDDGEFFSRLILTSSGVRHCPQACSYYRSRVPDSLSGQRTANAWRSAFLSLELTAQKLLSIEDSPRTRRACGDTFQRLYYNMYPDCSELAQACRSRTKAFGGGTIRPEMGPKLQIASALIGWKFAKRLKKVIG